MDNLLPVFGAFSVLFFLLIGGLWLALTVLWILVPFTLFAIRKQAEQQALTTLRLEKQLAELLEIARNLHGQAEPPETKSSTLPPS
jgi:hypothetical protein